MLLTHHLWPTSPATDLTHVSRLRVTLNGTDKGSPRNSGESGIPSMPARSVRPLLVVNRILFIRAGWAYRTIKVEVLVPAYSLHYGPTLSTQCEAVGTVPTGQYGAECTVYSGTITKE